jgi:type II restriction enzyme
MKLSFAGETAGYKSASQIARYWTEHWVGDQVYCANCGEANLDKYENNRPVADFHCANCNEEYELKSQKEKFGTKILDGAYRTMCQRLASSNNPNFILLTYNQKATLVTDLLIIPKHFFVSDLIEKRKPLGPTARRAGWIGCNILLHKIPEAGKIFLIRNSVPISKDDVLKKWQQTAFLRKKPEPARGWLIEVMRCVENIGRPTFFLDDVYKFENRLRASYPTNRHVKEKIRQQLQVLRDRGILEFAGRGQYRLIAS